MKKPMTLEQYLRKVYEGKIKKYEKQLEESRSKCMWMAYEEEIEDKERDEENLKSNINLCESVLGWIDEYNRQYAEWERKRQEQLQREYYFEQLGLDDG